MTKFYRHFFFFTLRVYKYLHIRVGFDDNGEDDGVVYWVFDDNGVVYWGFDGNKEVYWVFDGNGVVCWFFCKIIG